MHCAPRLRVASFRLPLVSKRVMSSSPSHTLGPIEGSIWMKLMSALQPAHLEVVNEVKLHELVNLLTCRVICTD